MYKANGYYRDIFHPPTLFTLLFKKMEALFSGKNFINFSNFSQFKILLISFAKPQFRWEKLHLKNSPVFITTVKFYCGTTLFLAKPLTRTCLKSPGPMDGLSKNALCPRMTLVRMSCSQRCTVK